MLSSCLVLLSGGQDSCTCLAWAKQEFASVHSISFDYGQKHRIELGCASILSEMANTKSHLQLKISSLKQLGNSTLLKNSKANSSDKKNNFLPASFIPGRNYLFLGLAAAHAYSLNINNLVIGTSQTDYNGYPDCRDDTIDAIQLAVSLAMQTKFTIYTPLMYKTKAETVLMMQDMGKLDWYKETYTCYKGKKLPCMICSACKARAKGFEQAQIDDPYLTAPLTYWEALANGLMYHF